MDKKANDLLSVISTRYNEILGENLIGIYVHGSIAFGCFNWDNSDIDFIVVVDKPVSQQEKSQLIHVMENLREKAPPKGFEMSVVLSKHCKNFIYPTPYELHFSNNCLCYGGDDKTDYDLAAHFTVIKNVGIALSGPPIPNVFGDIPKEYYLDSIRKDIENATEDVHNNPVYIILNLCRVYAFSKNGLILSKEQGGSWGADNLPEKYKSLITAMLNNYTKGIPYIKNEVLQTDFCKYMLNLI